MTTDWHLVLGRDGTVLGATDGAPLAWVGKRLENCTDAPEDLKEAERALLDRTPRATLPFASKVLLQSTRQPVHLTVIDAVPLRRVPTDLRAVLRSSLETLERQAHSCDVSLDVQVDDQVPELVSIDPEKIAWVVTVLVGNALRYVSHGSRVMPGGSILVRATYTGAEVALEIQDDGPGISEDKLRSLFLAGPDHPPVGLGLVMVREVIAAHGGRVVVESDTDALRHGTTIRLTLPTM